MFKHAAAAALGLTVLAGPALAQNVNANNLVSVNISNVANEIAEDLDVSVDNIAATVQVPVGVAANVCNVEANVLAQGGEGEDAAECTAESTSEALNKTVQRSMTDQ